MRFVAAVSVIVACIAGAALAQETPAPEPAAEVPPAQLQWARRANGNAFARNYPSRALDANTGGAAVICCTILPTGRLDCEVGFEWPQNFGFGEATLRVAREFRLTEESAAQHAGGRLRRMIVWQLSGSRTRQFEDALARIREGTENVCGPAIDWSERNPNDIVVTGASTSEQ